jgi:hypothetical protein
MTTAQSERLKKRFLASFRMTGNITESCEAVGIGSRTTIYNWQEHDDVFAAGFREAEIQATERLESEARSRAMDGTEKPIYQGGVLVGTVVEKSDTLLIFLLKARAPEKYRERYDVKHGGKVDHQVTTIQDIRRAIGIGTDGDDAARG